MAPDARAAQEVGLPPEQALDLRPEPVLALGFVGDGTGECAGSIAALLLTLAAECARIVAADRDLFAPGQPRLRFVTGRLSAPEGAIAQAAIAAGAEVRAVIPGEMAPAGTGAPLCPGGEPDDPRALARAGSALLDRSDILIARWDGLPKAGARPRESPIEPGPHPGGDPRGGTAAIVQEAVERRMPVLLLSTEQGCEAMLLDDPDELLLPAVAADLPRIPLARNLDRVLARAFAPPADAAERQALRDALAEPAPLRSLRPEYRCLLALAASAPTDPAATTEAEDLDRAMAVAALVSREAVAAAERATRLRHRMEELATFYGDRVRSGIVLRYGLPAFGSLLIALLSILAPRFGLAWLGVQAFVTTLLIVEAGGAVRGRWNERWLDYRSLAERLRCDRFLEPFGIGAARIETATSQEDPPWMRWVHRRHRRAHWVGGAITVPVVAAALGHLVTVEIAGQIRYHGAAAIRFRSLSVRLRALGVVSIGCVLAATLVLLLVPGDDGPTSAGVRALLLIGLITLPSVFLAARGLRAEAAFDVAAARSEGAIAALRRLRDRIEAVPPDHDRLAEASRAAAAAMILDTVDWRVGLQRSRAPYRTAPATSTKREAC